MEFVMKSPETGPLPQEAMRRIVEAVDGWRGQSQAFVVFHDNSPYEVVSVHPTAKAAQTAAKAERGLSYFGPIAPRPAAAAFKPVRKTMGCFLTTIPKPVSTVVLLGANDVEVARFNVNLGGALPNSQTDIEALFLTPSGIDKFVIPYLTRVFGADYAAAHREDWIKE
jgi:hypothetical protein